MLIGELLLEYNIVNPEEIVNFLGTYAERLDSPVAKKWLTGKKVRKWMTDNEPTSNELEQVPDNMPDWVTDVVNRGETIYSFESTPELRDQIEHLIDYLNWVHERSTTEIPKDAADFNQQKQIKFEAEKALKGFDQNRYNVEQAVELSDKWLEEITSTDSKIAEPPKSKTDKGPVKEEGANIVLDLSDGFTIRELVSKKALAREGNQMKHCVGSYSGSVSSGKLQIYSLRDSDNNPHVTFEIRDGRVGAAKGKHNRSPIQRYVPYLMTALQKLNYPPSQYGSSDLSIMGILWSNDHRKYGLWKDLATEKWKKDQYTMFGFDQTQKLFHKSIGMILELSDRGIQELNEDLNLSERTSAAPYVTYLLNQTYDDSGSKISSSMSKAMRFFGLFFDETDNQFKLITDEAMTKVFEDGEYDYYRRGDNYYLKVKDNLMQILVGEPGQKEDGTYTIQPTFFNHVLNYRSTIERFLNHRNKFGHQDTQSYRNSRKDFNRDILREVGLIYYDNKFQTPEEAGKIVYSDKETNVQIVELDEYFIVIEDDEPIILLRIYEEKNQPPSLHIQNVLAERFDGEIPNRIVSILIEFLNDYKVKFLPGDGLRDAGIYHDGQDKFGEADDFNEIILNKNGLEIRFNPALRGSSEGFQYALSIDGEDYNGFQIDQDDNRIDISGINDIRTKALPSPHDQTIADFLNKKKVQVGVKWRHGSLLSMGLDYDFGQKKFILLDESLYEGRMIHKTPKYLAIMKYEINEEGKSVISLIQTGEKRATVKIEFNPRRWDDDNNSPLLTKITYSKRKGIREIAVNLLIDFMNSKGRDLKMQSKLADDIWMSLDIQKNSDGTLSSLLSGTEEEMTKRKIMAGKHTFDDGYSVTKSRSGGVLKYTLENSQGYDIVRIRMDHNGLPIKVDWQRNENDPHFDVQKIRKHIIDIIDAYGT